MGSPPMKHRDAINDMMAELGAADSAPEIKTTISIAILNNVMGDLALQDAKYWHGIVQTPVQNVILANSIARIKLNVTEGALVYVGPNLQGGPDNCAWVLAWSVSSDGSGNKIYAETGPSTKYSPGYIDWDAIKSKLEMSSYKSYYHDELTRAEESAQIDGNDKHPRAAAAFDVTGLMNKEV